MLANPLEKQQLRLPARLLPSLHNFEINRDPLQVMPQIFRFPTFLGVQNASICILKAILTVLEDAGHQICFSALPRS